MKTAVIYARYSSDSQTEQSIDGQLRVCEEYAKNNNILIVQTYIDRAMTGTNDKRPDFQQMLKDSHKKQWNYVLVYKLDRFSRDKYESVVHKKTLERNGVKLISAMDNIPDSPEGIILESLLEGMNQYYSAELAQKIRRGMHESRLKGNYQGGGVPYGYKVVDKKLIIDEEKAEIVKYIFEQYSIGLYVRNIIDNLTSKGVLYKDKPFASNTIYNILKNEKYTGIYRHEDEIITNMYPKILDKALYDKVKAKTKINFVGKQSVRNKFLLRNKLTCGYCGKPISSSGSTSKLKKVIHYYKCLSRKKYHGECESKTIRKEFLETFIMKTIIKEISKPNIMDMMIDKILEVQSLSKTENSMLEYLIKEQRQTQTQLNNILKAIELGVVNRTTSIRMKELEEKLDELERHILIEKTKTSLILSREDVKQYFIEAIKLEPEMIIDNLIKQIVVYNDRLEIYFNTPLKTSPNNTDSLFYYHKSFLSILSKNQYENIEEELYVYYHI